MLIPMLAVVAALQQAQEVRADPVCSAEIRWAVSGPQMAGRATSDRRVLSLFSAVAQPACQSAEIRLTAAYFDAADDLVCGGAVANVATQSGPTQITTLELRLTNFDEWVTWRSGPHEETLRLRPLSCINPDGTAPVAAAALDRATSVRVYATILTPFRGLATAELQVAIQPLRR